MSSNPNVYAIDLSHLNSPINWNKLNPGIKIIILKASQGANFKDPEFSDLLKQVRAKGLVLGVYHFLTPNATAQQQADNFLSRNVNFKNNALPPIVDIEQLDSIPGADAAIQKNPKPYLQLIQDFLNIVQQKTGRTPMIYTDKGYWPTLHNPDFSKYPLWVAAYQSQPPGMFGGWHDYTLWQFSQRGSYANSNDGGDCDWSLLNPKIQLSDLINSK